MKGRWIVRAMVLGIASPCMNCGGAFAPRPGNCWFCTPCLQDPSRGLSVTRAFHAGMRAGRDLVVKAICGMTLHELAQKEANGGGS